MRVRSFRPIKLIYAMLARQWKIDWLSLNIRLSADMRSEYTRSQVNHSFAAIG